MPAEVLTDEMGSSALRSQTGSSTAQLRQELLAGASSARCFEVVN